MPAPGLLVQTDPALAPVGDPVDVRVVTTMQASADGLTLNTYIAGETYTMPRRLACMFVREGWGHVASQTPGPTEAKVVAPQTFKRGPGRPRKIR